MQEASVAVPRSGPRLLTACRLLTVVARKRVLYRAQTAPSTRQLPSLLSKSNLDIIITFLGLGSPLIENVQKCPKALFVGPGFPPSLNQSELTRDRISELWSVGYGCLMLR